MFDPKASPIAHIPVYKRIALNEPKLAEPCVEQRSYIEIYTDAIEAAKLQSRNDRMWNLVVQTACGVNPPAPSEYEAPSEDAA